MLMKYFMYAFYMTYTVIYKSLAFVNRIIWGKHDEEDEVTKTYLLRNTFCTSSRLLFIGITLYLFAILFMFNKTFHLEIVERIASNYYMLFAFLPCSFLISYYGFERHERYMEYFEKFKNYSTIQAFINGIIGLLLMILPIITIFIFLRIVINVLTYVKRLLRVAESPSI